MAQNAHLWVEGANQGAIQGDSTIASMDRVGTIAVHAFYHEVEKPVDAASGYSTGHRRHQPLTIVKRIDRSSTLLATALTNNEIFESWMLRFYRPTPTGEGDEQHYYTIELGNARIASIRLEMLHNLYPENEHHPVYERISFAYQTITLTYEPHATSSVDSVASGAT